MKYDDASWHYGGDFPNDLPQSAGATHIAMFVAWAVLHGLGSDVHTDEFSEEFEELQRRDVTPGEWFLGVCDEKFTDEDLNDEGNRFASFYYGDEKDPNTGAGSYLADYEEAVLKMLENETSLPKGESCYYAPDTWQTFAIISTLIQSRYDEWRKVR